MGFLPLLLKLKMVSPYTAVPWSFDQQSMKSDLNIIFHWCIVFCVLEEIDTAILEKPEEKNKLKGELWKIIENDPEV